MRIDGSEKDFSKFGYPGMLGSLRSYQGTKEKRKYPAFHTKVKKNLGENFEETYGKDLNFSGGETKKGHRLFCWDCPVPKGKCPGWEKCPYRLSALEDIRISKELRRRKQENLDS